MKRRRIITPDSDEESDTGSDTQVAQISSSTTNNRTTVQKATARKRGRPPAPTKKKIQRVQVNSDEDGSYQPDNSQDTNDQSENEDDSDSDYSVGRSNKRPVRTSVAAKNKNQRLQNGSLRDASPQPSTSQQRQNQNNHDSDSESDSDSGDSDYGPVNERDPSRVKPTGKKQPPPKSSSSTTKKKISKSTMFKSSQADNSVVDNTTLIESLAQKLVYFLLIEDQKKYVIRRKAIVTHVFKDDYSPKLYALVIRKANIMLQKIYGMVIIELENQKDSYLIGNNLRRELGICDYFDLSRLKQQQYGLILFLLTVIYMNENVITEDELTKSLRPLGIDLRSNNKHPVFGDVKKYITSELVKQMYLNYECVSKEPPSYEFTWGLRAKCEFGKMEILKEFVCTVMDDTSPEDWRMQFRDAQLSENSAKC